MVGDGGGLSADKMERMVCCRVPGREEEVE